MKKSVKILVLVLAVVVILSAASTAFASDSIWVETDKTAAVSASNNFNPATNSFELYAVQSNSLTHQCYSSSNVHVMTVNTTVETDSSNKTFTSVSTPKYTGKNGWTNSGSTINRISANKTLSLFNRCKKGATTISAGAHYLVTSSGTLSLGASGQLS